MPDVGQTFSPLVGQVGLWTSIPTGTASSTTPNEFVQDRLDHKENHMDPIFAKHEPGDPVPCPDCLALYEDGLYCEKHHQESEANRKVGR